MIDTTRIKKALRQYQWPERIVQIGGCGNIIVVYATLGDFRVACLTSDYEVVWDVTACDGMDGLTGLAIRKAVREVEKK